MVTVTMKTTGDSKLDLYNANDESTSLLGVYYKNQTKSIDVLQHKAYKIKITDDSKHKNIQLTRNGVPLLVGGPERVSTLYSYKYVWNCTEDDLSADANYVLTTTDKCCNVAISQIDHNGNVTYEYRYDGETYSKTSSSSLLLAKAAYYSKLSLSIPYDDWKPISVTKANVADPVTIPFTYQNGVATCSITVPEEENSDYVINWQEPEPLVVEVEDEQGGTQTVQAHQQPKITIMRSGEGNILLKGQCNLYDEQQSIDQYEREFGYPANNGWVVNAVANCIDPVTYVTVPDVDYLGRGGYLDMTDWGFNVDITPVPGQTVKSLMLGWIVEDDGRQYIEWQDFLGQDYTDSYFNDTDGDGTYTFSFTGDEMNWWIGDYIVNIVMGPEEAAVETGKTLSFVRQGGRGQSFIEWYDESGRDFYFEDGNSSVLIPNEELQDNDLKMYIDIEEGEVLHVYKNGADITSQFALNGQSTKQHWLLLEPESATYTLLIDAAPDANPTWTVMQSGGLTGSQVVVTRNGADETTVVDGSVITLPIDGEGVEKVTLRVPIGDVVPVTKYQIRLESIAYGTGTRVVGYLMPNCGMDRPSANALIEGLPGLIPTQYDSEADAQPIVDGLTAMGAVAVIVPVATSTTQVIPNNTPIRVMRNGEEVTFLLDFSDPSYAVYEVPVASLTDETWEVSYDTNHRQTILRTGGTGAVEIGYTYIGEDAITVSAEKGLTIIDLPSFHWKRGNFVEFAIEALEDEEVKIYRNGEDVTDVFGEPQSLVGKNWYYISSYSNNTLSDFGFQLREPATWEIKIESSLKMLNAYANNDVTIVLSQQKDGEVLSEGGKDNSIHAWARKGETYVVKFFPKHGEELTRLEIGWNAVDIEQETRLVKNDDGSYSFTLQYDDIMDSSKRFDIFATFGPGSDESRTVIIAPLGSKWVSAKVTHVDGTTSSVGNPIENGAGSLKLQDGDILEVDAATTAGNPIVAVRMNGTDVTENPDYLTLKEDTKWHYKFSDIQRDAVIQIVYSSSHFDMNKDGSVTIADVTRLVNKILGKE